MEDFTHDPIEFAYLSLQLDGALVAQTQADQYGSFRFMNIEAGSYDLVISKSGLSPLKVTNVFISPNELSELNPIFEARGFDQDTIVFTYKELQCNATKKRHHVLKNYCSKRQLRAARKLEKQVIH